MSQAGLSARKSVRVKTTLDTTDRLKSISTEIPRVSDAAGALTNQILQSGQKLIDSQLALVKKEAAAAKKAAARAASGSKKGGSGSSSKDTDEESPEFTEEPVKERNGTTNNKPTGKNQYKPTSDTSKIKSDKAERNKQLQAKARENARAKTINKEKSFSNAAGVTDPYPGMTESEQAIDAYQKSRAVSDVIERASQNPDYLQQLSAPSYRLSATEQKAVNQMVPELVRNRNQRIKNGNYVPSLEPDTVDLLQNKTKLGGQTLAGFTAGLAQSVPFLEPIENAIESATGVRQNTLDELRGYSTAAPIASTAGTIAGKMAQYGLVNDLLSGTKYAAAAQNLGGKTADALKSVPFLGDFVTQGTGQAIGNIASDMGVDLLLDTIPELAANVSNGESAQQIASDAAKNVAINLAGNVAGEAVPAIVRGLRGTLTDSAQQAVKQNAYTPEQYDEIARALSGETAVPSLGDGLDETTPSILLPHSAGNVNTGTSYLPDNTPVSYTWKAVDANDLVASNDALGAPNHSYPKEYQNRNRDSAASVQQITRMANNLNPQRLADSANIGDGSPLIRSDNVVLSGNGRTSAIQQAYRTGKADGYKAFVQSNAQKYGIDPSTLPQNPVLVRVADDGQDMLSIARKANESTTASFGAAENALNYSSSVLASSSFEKLDPFVPVTGNKNEPFVKSILSEIVPTSEYNRMVKPDGSISADGYKTVKDSLFAAAYGNNDRLFLLAEGGDDASRNLTAAMRDSAMNAVSLKRMVQAGDLPAEFDVTADVSAASDLYGSLKSGMLKDAQTVSDYIDRLTLQNGILYDGFEECPYSSMSLYIAKIMEDNRRSGKQTAEFLNALYGSAKEGPGGEITLEGITNARTRQDIIDDATRRFYQAPERAGNGKTAPSVPFSGKDWANSMGDHPQNAGKAQELPEVTASVPRPSFVPELAPSPNEVYSEVPMLSHPNTVGAAESGSKAKTVLNQDYGTRQNASGFLSEEQAKAIGVGKQKHTVYSMKESEENAASSFEAAWQSAGDYDKAIDDTLNALKKTKQWSTDDFADAKHLEDLLQGAVTNAEKGTPEYDTALSRLRLLYKRHSAAASEAGRALRENAAAPLSADTSVQKFNQASEKLVDSYKSNHKNEAKALESLAKDLSDMTETVGRDADNMDTLIRDTARAHKKEIDVEKSKELSNAIRAGADEQEIFSKLLEQAAGVRELDEGDYTFLKEAVEKMKAMPDSRERYQLETQLYARMAQKLPARSFSEKLNNFRYLAMLGNTRTHIRNILGNVGMGVLTRSKDNVAALLQIALPKDYRTKSILNPLSSSDNALKKAASDYAENTAYRRIFVYGDNGGKFNIGRGIEAQRRTYGKSPLGNTVQKLSNINSSLLTKEDEVFLKSAFADSLARNLKAKGYDATIFQSADKAQKQLLNSAVECAIADAKEATFHEDNFLSTAFSDFSSAAKDNGPAGKLAYMVAEGLLPFKKTPINIAKNALEYNPLGGAAEAIYRSANGEGGVRVMDAAAKGITGGVLMGIGYLLAKSGMLQGSSSGSDKVNAYQSALGQQNYSVKLGDTTYTIDWASPAAVPLLLGAEMQDIFDGGYTTGQALDAFRHISQPVLETTMLQGLNDTLDNISYADSGERLTALLETSVGSYAQQFVPTALGQVARSIDPNRRSSYGGGDSKNDRDFNYAITKLKNKIPVLSMESEPYIDQWGREEPGLDIAPGTTPTDYAARFAYNLLSPGYLSKENVTPVDELLQKVYEDTGEEAVIPALSKNYVNLAGGGTKYLTPEQKTAYAKASGQTAYDILDTLRGDSVFQSSSPSDQASMISDVYSLSRAVGAKQAVPELAASGQDSKLYKAWQDGGTGSVVQSLTVGSVLSTARNEKKEATGNEDATLGSAEKWSAIKEIPTLKSDEQRVSAYLSSASSTDKAAGLYNKYGAKAAAIYLDARAGADANGNGSISQDEMKYYFSKVPELSTEEQRWLWYTVMGWKKGL